MVTLPAAIVWWREWQIAWRETVVRNDASQEEPQEAEATFSASPIVLSRLTDQFARNEKSGARSQVEGEPSNELKLRTLERMVAFARPPDDRVSGRRIRGHGDEGCHFELSSVRKLFRLVGIDEVVENLHYRTVSSDSPTPESEDTSVDTGIYVETGEEGREISKYCKADAEIESAERYALSFVSAFPGGLPSALWTKLRNGSRRMRFAIETIELDGRVRYDGSGRVVLGQGETEFIAGPEGMGRDALTMLIKHGFSIALSNSIGKYEELRRPRDEVASNLENLSAAFDAALTFRRGRECEVMGLVLAQNDLVTEKHAIGLNRLDRLTATFPGVRAMHTSHFHLLRGWLRLRVGRLDEAAIDAETARMLGEQGYEVGLHCDKLLGGVEHARQSPDSLARALSLFRGASEIARVRRPALVPRLLIDEAMVLRDQGHIPAAKAKLGEAKTILQNARGTTETDPSAKVAVCTILAEIELYGGRAVAAKGILDDTRRLFRHVAVTPMRRYCVLRRLIEISIDFDSTGLDVEEICREAIRLADLTDSPLFQIESRLLAVLTVTWEGMPSSEDTERFSKALTLLTESHPASEVAQRCFHDDALRVCWRLLNEVVALHSDKAKLAAASLSAARRLLAMEQRVAGNLVQRHMRIERFQRRLGGTRFDRALAAAESMKPGPACKDALATAHRICAGWMLDFTQADTF